MIAALALMSQRPGRVNDRHSGGLSPCAFPYEWSFGTISASRVSSVDHGLGPVEDAVEAKQVLAPVGQSWGARSGRPDDPEEPGIGLFVENQSENGIEARFGNEVGVAHGRMG